MMPQVVEFRDVMPQTMTGKVAKRELSAPAGV
jgi:acyl-coenzyme A synthetase/AMP-(fatty) acid ligase